MTPEYLSVIASAIENHVAQLNEYLTMNIVRQIIGTFNNLDKIILAPSTISDFHKILDLGQTIAEAQAVIESLLPDIQKEIRQAFLDSAKDIARDLDKFTKDIVNGIKAEGLEVPKELTDPEIKQMETAYRRTNKTVYNLTRSTASQTQKIYFNECDKAYNKVVHGVSLNKAVQEAVQEITAQGVSTVEYPTGHEDKIEVAVARAVRTGINQANANIALTRCAEIGADYVYVSEHYGARVTDAEDYTNHAWWQGKVYKVNWNDKNENYNGESVSDFADAYDPTLDKIKQELKKDVITKKFPDFVSTTGYGDMLGLCGINCRHTFTPFYPQYQKIPESRIDPAENERRYKLSQKQRQMERNIRKTKREIEGLKELNTPEAKQKLEKKKKLLKDQLKAYYDFCKENRLSTQNFRINI